MAGLNREQWAALEPLMDHALDLPPEDRVAWLADLGARAPEQAAQLEALLAAEQTGVGMLDSPLEPPTGALEALAGRTIGRYTLIRPIGHGGMGTVWLGCRSDGRFESEVAIKLLNLALIGQSGEERFTQEGNVLARLTHPHIARLLDAGVTPGGQPYLVLEHIDGERIDHFVNRCRYPVERRIALFLDVLDGVATAHANLVVHRDIKPSNIMVTAAGDVKLLDFGIAKMLTPELGAEASSITAHDGRALTPEYAAPEQIRGEPVSTATDVYSLGVLLYVLLGGRHPTGEGCRTPVEHLRAAVDLEPPRLSDAVITAGTTTREDLERIAAARGATPERLQRLFLGDLDNILARALKKVPAERYQTVAAFADDLKHFLRHEPVSARPDSLAYRARKFVRRNRASVVAAAVAALSLLAGATVTLRQLKIARAERDRAASALRRSEATTAFESLIFRLIEPGGKPLTYRQLLDKGRTALDLHFRADPVSRIQVSLQFAQNYLRQDEVLPADTVLRRAVGIADSIHDLQWQARTRCDLAETYGKRGIADSSFALLKEARGYLGKVPAVEMSTANFCDGSEAGAYIAARQYDSASVLYARILDRIRAEGDTSNPNYSYSLNDYARSLVLLRRAREARPVLTRMLEMVRAGSSADPDAVPIARYNTSTTYESLGEFVARFEFFRRELALTPEPEARLQFEYAAMHDLLGRADSAVAWYRLALAKGDLLDGQRRCVVRLRLARLARMAGNLPEAAAHQREAPGACAAVAGAPWVRGVLAADRITAPSFRSPAGNLGERIRVALDSAGYTPESRSRMVLEPLRRAAELSLETRDWAGAARYAGEIIRIARLDSLTLARSGMVGLGLLLQARAESGQGHAREGEKLAASAVTPLAFGMGPDHPLTREARALADSLRPGARPTPR